MSEMLRALGKSRVSARQGGRMKMSMIGATRWEHRKEILEKEIHYG
jgi:hypothetical protein